MFKISYYSPLARSENSTSRMRNSSNDFLENITYWTMFTTFNSSLNESEYYNVILYTQRAVPRIDNSGKSILEEQFQEVYRQLSKHNIYIHWIKFYCHFFNKTRYTLTIAIPIFIFYREVHVVLFLH